MTTNRKTAIIVGVLFIVGTVSGILSAVFTGSIFGDPDYLVKIAENNAQVRLGAVFVLVMGFSLAMVPVMMFPIFKKKNEALALGAVVFRGPVEALLYVLTVLSWLMLVTLANRFVAAGMPAGSHFQDLGAVLVQSGNQINQVLEIAFSLGALMFYDLFYQTRLIPRWLALWGVIGAVLYHIAGWSDLFEVDLGVLIFPLALQEMVMALWLIFKGFNPSANVTENS
jgi:hypothetical protein